MTILEFARSLAIGMAGLAAFLYYVAHIGEKGASVDAKDRLRRTFQSARVTPRFRHAFIFFLTASNRYFGARIFSQRAVVRSVALSVAWMSAVFVGFALFDHTYVHWFFIVASGAFAWQAVALVCAGLLSDFLSVCITRSLVMFAFKKGRTALFFAAVFDVLLCAAVFYVFFSATKLVVAPDLTPQSPSGALHAWISPEGPSIAAVLPDRPTLGKQGGPVGEIATSFSDLFEKIKVKGGRVEIIYWFPDSILFYSSLLTSIWMWLYVIGYWLLFFAVRLDGVKRIVERNSNVDNDPFHALAWVILIAAIATSVISIFIFAMVKMFVL